jgi:hypothetical protein
MARYVFRNSDAQSKQALVAARKAARSQGAPVVKPQAGTMLLEVTPAQLPEVAQALPGWRYAAERKTTRAPERKRAERWRRPRARSRPFRV